MSKIPPVDVSKRKALLAKLAAMGMKLNSRGVFEFDHDDGFPRYVSLEDFFEGTVDSEPDFAVNLSDHPGNRAIYELLRSIRNREDVLDVLVGVVDAEGYQGDDSPDWWVYSDHVVLISSLREEDIVDRHESDVPQNVYSASTGERIKRWFAKVFQKVEYPHQNEYPSYTSEIVKNWFGEVYPPEVSEIPTSDIKTRCGLSQPPPGYNAYYLWWD